MPKTQFRILSKHFRITLYNDNAWERGDEHFIFIKVGGAKTHNVMVNDYCACQVFPIRYDCLRHAQPILKYALSKDPHDWNNRTVEELEEDDWKSSVCK